VKIKLAGALVLVSALTAAWLAAHGYQTFATPYCSDGATNVTTATQVVSAVAAGNDVCVTAVITDNIVLENREITAATGTGTLTEGSQSVSAVTGTFTVGMRITGPGLARATRVTAVGAGTLTIAPAASSSGTGVALTAADDVEIGTSGDGKLGYVEIDTMNWLTFHARIDSTRIDASSWIWFDNSVMGGTENARTLSQIVFMPSTSSDVAFTNNDIGWAIADTTGNTGYGMRVYGDNDRLQIVGNKIHDVAGDGIQGIGGDDVLVDRNEIGPVASNPESDEHSDIIQITGNGENLRITNNWMHDQGFYNGATTGNSGSPYIHGGSDGSVLIENNLIEHALGRMEVCGLGTGGTERSNITIRQNTISDQGISFPDFPGFEWDCDAGTGNTIERNIAVDPDGGFIDHGFTTYTGSSNLFGVPTLVALNTDGDCTSTNCNPDGQDPIGYRKPTGVNW
jgi:hypothetical protein